MGFFVLVQHSLSSVQQAVTVDVIALLNTFSGVSWAFAPQFQRRLPVDWDVVRLGLCVCLQLLLSTKQKLEVDLALLQLQACN